MPLSLISASILALSLLLAARATASPSCPVTVDQDSLTFVDCTGAQRFFHGVNVVYKAAPWAPISDHFDVRYSLSQEDAQILLSLGLNTVRLGVMWPGVNPESEAVNSTYLEEMVNIVSMLNDVGITTLVDAHQDCLAAEFCGEGAPSWAVPLPEDKSYWVPWPFAAPFNSSATSRIPTPAECATQSWPEFQVTGAGAAGYQALYTNKNVSAQGGPGMRDAFGAFWSTVSKRFASVDGVLGYEVLNEPWAGDIYEDPLLIVPGVADRDVLEPFQDAIAHNIRGGDPLRPIFYEAVTYDDFIPNGFSHSPANDNNTVLSFHFYEPPQFSRSTQFDTRVADAKRLKSASFLTEFGICVNADFTSSSPSSDSSDRDVENRIRSAQQRLSQRLDEVQASPQDKIAALNHLEAVLRHGAAKSFPTTLSDSARVADMEETMDAADEHLVGWMGWEYKSFIRITGWGESLFNESSGAIRPDVQRALARTYPHSVAGRVSSMAFNSTTSDFSMTWTPKQTAPGGETVIYLATGIRYPTAPTVTITPSNSFTYSIRTSHPQDSKSIEYAYLTVTPTGPLPPSATITISP